MNRTYILSRRQAYQHTQDVRFSSIGSGTGRTCAKPSGKTSTVGCVGDSKTPRPARSPHIAGPLAAVGGLVTVRGRLPVTVTRPGDGPGQLARGCYGPSSRQRWLRCRRLGGDGPSSPPRLGLGRGKKKKEKNRNPPGLRARQGQPMHHAPNAAVEGAACVGSCGANSPHQMHQMHLCALHHV